MHEAYSYKMSLERSSFSATGLTGSKGSLKKQGLRHPDARTKQEIQKHEYPKTGLRSPTTLRKVGNKNHISLINLLPLVICTIVAIHTISSSEKRHEFALIKRRHEELERQYQVSVRLKEQENCLKL